MSIYLLSKEIGSTFHASNAMIQTDSDLKKGIQEIYTHICSALRFLGYNDECIQIEKDIYNPFSIWTRTSYVNFNFMWTMCVAYCHEYKYRFGRRHPVITKLSNIRHNITILDDDLFVIALPKRFMTRLGKEASDSRFITKFPCVVPKKFEQDLSDSINVSMYNLRVIDCYRNHWMNKIRVMYVTPACTKRNFPSFDGSITYLRGGSAR